MTLQAAQLLRKMHRIGIEWLVDKFQRCQLVDLHLSDLKPDCQLRLVGIGYHWTEQQHFSAFPILHTYHISSKQLNTSCWICWMTQFPVLEYQITFMFFLYRNIWNLLTPNIVIHIHGYSNFEYMLIAFKSSKIIKNHQKSNPISFGMLKCLKALTPRPGEFAIGHAIAACVNGGAWVRNPSKISAEMFHFLSICYEQCLAYHLHILNWNRGIFDSQHQLNLQHPSFLARKRPSSCSWRWSGGVVTPTASVTTRPWAPAAAPKAPRRRWSCWSGWTGSSCRERPRPMGRSLEPVAVAMHGKAP